MQNSTNATNAAADPYLESVIRLYFRSNEGIAASRAQMSEDNAANDETNALHLKAVSAQLAFIHDDVSFVMGCLLDRDRCNWPSVRASVGPRLTRSVLMLESSLNALAKLDNKMAPVGERIDAARVSFRGTDLYLKGGGARALQAHLRKCTSQGHDFWALADYWKHHFPTLPEPIEFQGARPVRDFAMRATGGTATGPVLHDLILPALGVALDLLPLIGDALNVPAADLTPVSDVVAAAIAVIM